MLTVLNNITAILLLFDLLLLAVWLFLKCFDGFNHSILPLFSRLSSWFENRKADEPEVETPKDDFLTGTYDVNAFRNRMKAMMDENGLYDVPEEVPKTDFTGVEIITNSTEMAVEKRIGR